MATKTKSPKSPELDKIESSPSSTLSQREVIFDIFRRWGFLQTTLDPLGQFLPGEPFPTPAPDGDLSDPKHADTTVAPLPPEFMHIASPERRQWIQERLEQAPFSTRSGPYPFQADPCRRLRTGHPIPLSRHQALLARRSDSSQSLSWTPCLPQASTSGSRAPSSR